MIIMTLELINCFAVLQAECRIADFPKLVMNALTCDGVLLREDGERADGGDGRRPDGRVRVAEILPQHIGRQ